MVNEDGAIMYDYYITCGIIQYKTKILINFETNNMNIKIFNSKNKSTINDISKLRLKYEDMLQKNIVTCYNKLFNSNDKKYHDSMMEIIEMAMI